MKKLLAVASIFFVFLVLSMSSAQAVTYNAVKAHHHERPIISRINQLSTQARNAIQNLKNNHPQSQISTLLSPKNPIVPQSGRLLTVLAFTILIEFVAYMLLAQTAPTTALLSSILINGITNPLINLIYYTLYDNVLVLETGVVIAETFMIFAVFNLLQKQIGLVSSAILSLLANLASYLIATTITRLIYDGTVVYTPPETC